MKLQVRPIFFLFLVLGPLALGPFVVIPFLMVQPINVTFRAAWKKSPTWIWRLAVVVSVLLSLAITMPLSPLFIGLDGPIPLAGGAQYELLILLPQLVVINAALVASIVCFPVAAASTFHTMACRKRSAE